MRFTFLGTSASNAFPEAFCNCRNCHTARSEGGRSLRKRSAALVNDDLLVDLGPDIMTASQLHGIDLTRVQHCIQTHAHADHLDLSHLLSRSPGFGVVGAPRLHFYASSQTLESAGKLFSHIPIDLDLLSVEAEGVLNLEIHELVPFTPMEIGQYLVTAFPANHALGSGAFLFAIESGDHAIFYGTDTASLSEDTWRAFRDFGMEFALVVLDHTYGPNEDGEEHLSAREISQHVRRMREEGVLKENGRALVTHIAHAWNPAHDELSAFAGRNGYEVAFDGLSIEI